MSDSDDEASLDFESAKQKFLKHINRLNNDTKSATDLLNEYYGECVACGQLNYGSECSCGHVDHCSSPNFSTSQLNDEFQMWVENKMIYESGATQSSDVFNGLENVGFTLAQYVETEPSRMSWQQLAKVVPPCSNPSEQESDEESYSVEDIMSNDEPIAEYGLDEIQTLQNDLDQLNRNYDDLVAEREFLIEQLQACEDRIDEINQEKQEIENEIDRLNRYNETVVAEQLISKLDEFSQAVQILLHASEFYDIKDLISAYARDGASLDEIKRQVILDAKLTKKQQLLSNVVVTPKPKNPDGLPNLHDSYLVDSYDI